MSGDADSDDPSIADAERLLRHVAKRGDANMLGFDEGNGSPRVRGGAFVWHKQDGCSVYRESVLLQNEMSPNDVKRDEEQLVISVTARHVRDVQLGVRPDPWPDDGGQHPRQVAHALIVNCHALGKNARARALSQLAKSADITRL